MKGTPWTPAGVVLIAVLELLEFPLSGAGLVAPTSVTVTAGAAELENRFIAMERRLEELSAENAALRRAVAADHMIIDRLAGREDNAATERKPGVGFAGKETKLVLGGTVQVFGETGGAPDARYAGIGDRFQLRRLRVAFAGAFAESVDFKVESDFGNAAIAGATGSRGQLTDAYVAWSKYPAFKLQAGQFKTPFGYEQLVADSRTLFVERSLANDRLTVGRQIGAMVSGCPVVSGLTYAFGVFNGNGVNTGANDNAKFMTAGRVTAVLLQPKGGAWPVAWSVGSNFFNTVDKGAFTGRRTGFGFDTQVATGPAQFGFEWLRNDCHPVSGAPVDGDGWYAFSAWNLSRRWQLLLRSDTYDSNVDRPDTTSHEWTYGITYFLNGDDLKLSLNYLRGYGPGPGPGAGRLIGRLQVVF